MIWLMKKHAITFARLALRVPPLQLYELHRGPHWGEESLTREAFFFDIKEKYIKNTFE